MEEEKFSETVSKTSDSVTKRTINLKKMIEPTIKRKTKYKEALGDSFLEAVPVKERNKYYSRISRRKHKEYVVELEK